LFVRDEISYSVRSLYAGVYISE